MRLAARVRKFSKDLLLFGLWGVLARGRGVRAICKRRSRGTQLEYSVRERTQDLEGVRHGYTAIVKCECDYAMYRDIEVVVRAWRLHCRDRTLEAETAIDVNYQRPKLVPPAPLPHEEIKYDGVLTVEVVRETWSVHPMARSFRAR
jgi:hypothetical protein